MEDPEWGLDFGLQKSIINYSAWTDRQRCLIRNFFFPSCYRNETPVDSPGIGELRKISTFKIRFIFVGPSHLFRVPLRESSKVDHHSNFILISY
jgi:hypothetical protein